MPFSRPSLATIEDRVEADIETRLTGGVPLLKVSVLRILAKVFSGAIHTAYGSIDFLSKQILPDLAETVWLERHAYSWGLYRIKADFALGDAIFTGVSTTVIPAGTVVVSDEGEEYYTSIEGTIAGGTATIQVEANEAGSASNKASGETLTLQSPITGVNDICTVDSGGITGGADEETDDELRARLLLRIKNPPAGGSASDYEQAGLAVSGVQNIYVYPNQDGLVATPGYVTVVVLGDSPKVPGAGILADVQTAVDAIKPVTATITVEPIDDVDVDLTISITPNTADVQAAITANLNSYFNYGVDPGGDILISQIRDAIIAGGATDYSITAYSVDGTPVSPPADVALSDFEFPIEGTFTYNTL